jgi:drug/metabolite transporter (DMT)-like permease
MGRDQRYHRAVESHPWLGFALLAPLLWAASNVIDERLVRGTSLLPWTMVAISGAFGSTPAVLLLNWHWPGWSTAALAAATGTLSVLVYFPYFVALGKEPAARVVVMWNLSPVLVLGLAATFLGEHPARFAAIAVGLLVASSVLAAYRGVEVRRWSEASLWMLVASASLATDSVMEKAVYGRVAFSVGLPWIALGSLLGTVLILAAAPKSRGRMRDVLALRLGALVVLNEGLNLLASWSLSYATSRGPVGFVAAVGGLQPLFVLLFQAAIMRRGMNRLDLVRLVGATALAATGLRLLDSAS